MIAPQSHHTGIEIKYRVFVFIKPNHPQSHHTGIEIGEIIGLPAGTLEPSIAPYWNWNDQGISTGDIVILPSIAPYWNWNISRQELARYVPAPQSHHTGIEIRSVSQSIRRQGFPQSHHTGIEIGFESCATRSNYAPQSHHTGIEINLHIVIQHKDKNPQSHHTGIEMKNAKPSPVRPLRALNRTILELK